MQDPRAEVCLVKSDEAYKTIAFHSRFMVDGVGSLVLELVKLGSMDSVPSEHAGSVYHQALRLLTPQEIVDRASAIAQATYIELERIKAVHEVPAFADLKEADTGKVGF